MHAQPRGRRKQARVPVRREVGFQGREKLGARGRVWSGLLALGRMKDWKPAGAAGRFWNLAAAVRFWIEPGIPCSGTDWAPTISQPCGAVGWHKGSHPETDTQNNV